MEIRVLGTLDALRDGRALAVPSGRARILLAVLALHAGRTVSVDRLAEAAWGDQPPPTVRSQIQTLVSALRRVLSAAPATDGVDLTVIETRHAGYALRAESVSTDLGLFHRHVREGRAEAAAGGHAKAVTLLRAALALWRGPAFDGLPSRLLEAECAQLEEIRLSVLEECAGLELDLALPTARSGLIAELQTLTDTHPLRESAHRLRMLALHRAGRPAEAVAAFHDARTVLANELGVEPGPALRALHQRILIEDPGLTPVPTAPSDAGPARTDADEPAGHPALRPAVRGRLYGRDLEVSALVALLEERRMVTLVGPPGVGKTRLAVEVAARTAERTPGGVYVVELDEVDGPELVPAAIAAGLGVPAGPGRPVVDALCARLAPHHTVLVLDNCEHLLDACARVADVLLANCPQLRLLATSREPLALQDEVLRPVGPLATPEQDGVEEVLATPAGQMFVERAAARLPGFTVADAAQARLVARICRAAEGIPLALELVAAQLRFHTLPEVAERLDHQLLLVRRRARPDRHRSLEAAIGWSHRLLTPGEQRVFARLSVFAGGFTLGAASAVATDPPELLPPTARRAEPPPVDAVVRDLVDRSLVLTVHDGQSTRYRLLESVREFAGHRLTSLGEEALVRTRHCSYFRKLAEDVHVPSNRGDRQDTSVGGSLRGREHVRGELPNLRAALGWSLGPGEVEDGFRLVGAMSWIWVGLPGEGQEWVERALARTHSAPPAARPRVLYAAGLISFSTDLARAATLLRQAAHAAEEQGDPALQLESLAQLSVVRCLQGQAQDAALIADAVLSAVLPVATPFATAKARVAVAIARFGLGHHAVAASQLELAEDVIADHDDREALATVRWARSELAYYTGETRHAAELSAAALRDTAVGHDLFATVCRQSQHARNLHAVGDLSASTSVLRRVLRTCLAEGLWMPAVDALVTAARHEADRARPGRAVTLLAAADALREATDRNPAPVERPLLEALRRRLQERLDPDEHAEAEKRGSAMTAERAIREGLAS